MRLTHTPLLSLLSIFAAAGLGLSSCNSNPVLKPDTPTDELESKDHDEAFRVEVTLNAAHYHGSELHILPPVEGAKIYDANVQKIVFENTPDGFLPKAGTPSKFAVKGGLHPDKKPADPASAGWTDGSFDGAAAHKGIDAYYLTIRFFAKDGDEITGEFGTPEESKIHQLFFIPEGIKATKFGDPATTYTPDYHYLGYYYMDTTPWDKEDGAFTGISNPIGLKGLIEFYAPDTQFDLRIQLMHAKVSKYLEDGKSTSPFYKPTDLQRAREDWEDLDLRIPVVVFADAADEYITSHSYEELTPEDKRLAEKLADALGISVEQAYADLLSSQNNDNETDHDHEH